MARRSLHARAPALRTSELILIVTLAAFVLVAAIQMVVLVVGTP
ncbi:hypothetical protein [Xanthobacter aminoxidans]|uniref:Uncharacterized protein n=1 Tax=Xanthobacter aminoxidans TaxID=186280 RepID=A0ABW6ZGN5_9HYPH